MMFGNSTTGFTMEDMFEEPVPCQDCGDVCELQVTRKCSVCGRLCCPECIEKVAFKLYCQGCIPEWGDKP